MTKRTHQLDLALLQESSPIPYNPKIKLLGKLYDERTKLSNTLFGVKSRTLNLPTRFASLRNKTI
jgi:hypothetical protein